MPSFEACRRYTWGRPGGGWGFADVDVSFIDDDPTGLTLVSGTRADATLDGPIYGGGVEVAVASNATLKVEYLRFDFDETVTVRATGSGGLLRRFNHDIDPIDTVKVAFNIKFGRERLREPLK